MTTTINYEEYLDMVRVACNRAYILCGIVNNIPNYDIKKISIDSVIFSDYESKINEAFLQNKELYYLPLQNIVTLQSIVDIANSFEHLIDETIKLLTKYSLIVDQKTTKENKFDKLSKVVIDFNQPLIKEDIECMKSLILLRNRITHDANYISSQEITVKWFGKTHMRAYILNGGEKFYCEEHSVIDFEQLPKSDDGFLYLDGCSNVSAVKIGKRYLRISDVGSTNSASKQNDVVQPMQCISKTKTIHVGENIQLSVYALQDICWYIIHRAMPNFGVSIAEFVHSSHAPPT